jgi:hypothetical protein
VLNEASGMFLNVFLLSPRRASIWFSWCRNVYGAWRRHQLQREYFDLARSSLQVQLCCNANPSFELDFHTEFQMCHRIMHVDASLC